LDRISASVEVLAIAKPFQNNEISPSSLFIEIIQYGTQELAQKLKAVEL
jgi:hypothetical protein